MKKALGIIKSNVLIFVGVLLFLSFFNYVAMGNALLALGIIAIIAAIYYIIIGVLSLFIGDKFSALMRKVFEIIAVCLFALLLFVGNVISLVNMIQASTDPNFPVTFLPNGWLILIIALLTSLALLGFYPVARLVKNNTMNKLGLIFACTFVLGALLNVVFDAQGTAITLGDIPFVYVTLLFAFSFYLFETLGEAKEEPKAVEQKAPAKKEEKKEEKVEEPAPEEAPEEPEDQPEEPKEE